MTVTSPGQDTGTGHGRPTSSHDARPTEAGRGTPMGVVALRRMLRKVADDIEAGRDPVDVEHGEARPRQVKAGVLTVSTRSADARSTAVAAHVAGA